MLSASLALASPAGYGASSSSSNSVRVVDNPSGAIRHVQQANEDGSYTFGYESADGSFRMENRDASGYVKGKYGYIDSFGQLQEFGKKHFYSSIHPMDIETIAQCLDYVAGAVGGQAVGFQSRTSQLPEQAGPLLPVVRNTPGQRALDFEYSSTDEDRDGFPDNTGGQIRTVVVPQQQTETVRLAPASTPTVVRVVEAPAAVAPQQTEVVRLAQVSVPTRQVEVIRNTVPTYVLQQPAVSAVRSQSYGSTQLDNFIRNLGLTTTRTAAY